MYVHRNKHRWPTRTGRDNRKIHTVQSPRCTRSNGFTLLVDASIGSRLKIPKSEFDRYIFKCAPCVAFGSKYVVSETRQWALSLTCILAKMCRKKGERDGAGGLSLKPQTTKCGVVIASSRHKSSTHKQSSLSSRLNDGNSTSISRSIPESTPLIPSSPPPPVSSCSSKSSKLWTLTDMGVETGVSPEREIACENRRS